jgi:hypothetical protein
MTMRRTRNAKIVATLGPASSARDTVRAAFATADAAATPRPPATVLVTGPCHLHAPLALSGHDALSDHDALSGHVVKTCEICLHRL